MHGSSRMPNDDRWSPTVLAAGPVVFAKGSPNGHQKQWRISVVDAVAADVRTQLTGRRPISRPWRLGPSGLKCASRLPATTTLSGPPWTSCRGCR